MVVLERHRRKAAADRIRPRRPQQRLKAPRKWHESGTWKDTFDKHVRDASICAGGWTLAHALTALFSPPLCVACFFWLAMFVSSACFGSFCLICVNFET